MGGKKAIFLDRDGVINKVFLKNGKLVSPRKYEDFELLPDVEKVLKFLKDIGFIIIVITNQPDIARGLIKKEELDKMHTLIREKLPVDDIFVCPHDDAHGCNCRKPKPGLLFEAAKKWNINLNASFIVGDTWKDVEAGKAAGCVTILINASYNQGIDCDYKIEDLKEILNIINKEEGRMFYIKEYLQEVHRIVDELDVNAIKKMIEELIELRKNGGRLFFLGVGGGAGNAAHAVNDFRKIAGIESYAPTDNVSELTARINDEGWDTVFVNWLKGSKLNNKDAVFVFSVGGGNAEKNISVNIVQALKYAKEVGAKILGIVGRDGGYTAKVADVCVIVPTINPKTVTPHTEAFQAVIWHLIISHPDIQINPTKWESTK
jgi:D-sedoheptulose 7-phosphate isomerase